MTGGSGSFDKFGWLKALHSDTTLPDKHFRLAVVIGVTYTRADGSGWFVELDALAAALPGGLSRRRLVEALRGLEERGYLVESDRSGGGRGVTAKRWFNLRKPPTPASGVSVNRDLWTTTETPDASGTGFGETPDASVRNPRRQRPKPLTPASHKVAFDQHERPPTGTSTGTSSGGAPSTSDAEPAPFCPRHPAGTQENCPRCGDHRRAHDAWEARRRSRSCDAKQARRDAIEQCPDCDEFGQVDCGNAVANCRHPNLAREESA
ncbi:hypothetical protein MCHLDSM_01457 [Mycolicibacterium chlorophenolicum]|uniref:Helix-turn-helix domain-containing protein n=1 Tax=Mycolicibacterium chlorophenolicum TaxID=37916 RepID=A0A0J6WGA1_9MYCO|nr:hypothetical protein MCHLDSM_01457 [Mycolicibacterium chlorophenolicum]